MGAPIYKFGIKSSFNSIIYQRMSTCEYCDMKFDNGMYKMIHVYTFHEIEKVGDKKCNRCGKDHSDQDSLARHYIAKHEIGHSVDNECPLCGKKFAWRKDLYRHIRAHDVKEKKYVCKICLNKGITKAYKYLQGLQRHNKIHSKMSKKKCPYKLCKFSSYENCEINRHIINVHEKQRKKKIRCVYKTCDVVCDTYSHLQSHITHKHLKERRYKCKLCEYKGKTVSNLNQHMRLKHNIGKKTCDICQTKDIGIVKKYLYKGNELKVCQQCYSKEMNGVTRKEQIVAKYLNKYFGTEYLICQDSKIYGNACTKYRPDFVYASDDLVLIVECDENQHKKRHYSCEDKRISNIFMEFPDKVLFVIRFNPDKQIIDGVEVKTPVSKRLAGLVEAMKYVTKNYKDLVKGVGGCRLVIFYLYYDSDNPNKTQTFYSVDLA
jgi:hypothetical protein